MTIMRTIIKTEPKKDKKDKPISLLMHACPACLIPLGVVGLEGYVCVLLL